MEALRSRKGFICDMDGVIYHGDRLLPGVSRFVDWLYREDKQFLFLTNSSARSPKELQQKLLRMGLEVDESHFYTSALATADFLKKQNPAAAAPLSSASRACSTPSTTRVSPSTTWTRSMWWWEKGGPTPMTPFARLCAWCCGAPS